MNTKVSYRFLIVTALFIACLLTSNIIIAKQIVVGPFILPAAIIIFPLSYIISDILTEVYGYQRSRRVIWTGFLCLGLSAVVFWIVRLLPGEATWQHYAGQNAYNAILGGMSSGGIVMASLLAYWTGEFSNSFTLAKMKILTRGRWLWTRTIGSTLLGELIDSFIFVLIASLFSVFPWSLFVTLVLTNYIFKCSIEALMTPITYLVVNGLKRRENEDYYDRGTNFTPFQI